MMSNNLDRLEAQLRSLFEGSLVKIFTGKLTSDDLINKLICAMQDNLYATSDGGVLAPDRYILEVPPADLESWQNHRASLNDMVIKLSEWGGQEGFSFNSSPSIEIFENPALTQPDWQIKVEFSDVDAALPDTAAMDGPELIPDEDLVPANAFLVIGGKTNYLLNKVLINIGRHSDNDLILDDQYVSRHHAQLRAINRRYVIFDAGSTGGILLNGKTVTQATLHPGDVIRIGMTHLIYVQDTTGDTPTTAIPLEPESGDELA